MWVAVVVVLVGVLAATCQTDDVPVESAGAVQSPAPALDGSGHDDSREIYPDCCACAHGDVGAHARANRGPDESSCVHTFRNPDHRARAHRDTRPRSGLSIGGPAAQGRCRLAHGKAFGGRVCASISYR